MGRGGIQEEDQELLSSAPESRRWTDERIRNELLEFIGDAEYWPPRAEFTAGGRRDLLQAVTRNGGVLRWAPKIGVKLRPAQERRGLTDKEAVREARKAIARYGDLPNAKSLRERGHIKLASAVTHAGGARAFCKRHGLG